MGRTATVSLRALNIRSGARAFRAVHEGTRPHRYPTTARSLSGRSTTTAMRCVGATLKCEPASLSRSWAAKMAAISLVGLWVKRPHMRGVWQLHSGWARRVAAPLRSPFRGGDNQVIGWVTVSYTHLRAHETRHDLVC